MADLTITAANVVWVSGIPPERSYNAGTTITAGQAVYRNTSSVWVLADNDSGTGATVAAASGIALNSASTGQPLAVAVNGSKINIGATTVKGEIYVLSSTAGGVCPAADLGSGDYVTILGIAEDTAGALSVVIKASGITV